MAVPGCVTEFDLNLFRQLAATLNSWFSYATRMRPLQATVSPGRATLFCPADPNRVGVLITTPPGFNLYMGDNANVQNNLAQSGLQVGAELLADTNFAFGPEYRGD